MSDPISKAEVDELIEKRAAEKVQSELASLQEEARAEGLRKGLEEAKTAFSENLLEMGKKVSEVCASVLREKEELLKAHERDWCLALEHCLKRFLVPDAGKKLALTRDWIEESLKGFNENARVVVHLNTEDFRLLQPDMIPQTPKNWEFREDSKLALGSIRAECEGGGILFERNDQRENLDQILNRALKNE